MAKRVDAEAAAWIARLHSPERNEATERGFRTWLAGKPEHRAAFELANDVWSESEHWPKPTKSTYVRRSLSERYSAVHTYALAASVAVLALIGAVIYINNSGLTTDIGEQRNLTLEDGTRIALNTDTQIHVDYDDSIRRVTLDRGEAFFEVAKNPARPFVVTAGDSQVRAIGTAFIVRKEEEGDLAVTLLEGKVTVTSPPREAVPPSPVRGKGLTDRRHDLVSAQRQRNGSSTRERSTQSNLDMRGVRSAGQSGDINGEVLLSPGERITFAAGSAKLDRPPVHQVTAWQRGQVVLDHTPLSSAIVEMNRYSVIQLTIDQPTVSRLEVTGVFRSGDSIAFAQAVAETYQLKVIHEPRRIRLIQR